MKRTCFYRPTNILICFLCLFSLYMPLNLSAQEFDISSLSKNTQSLVAQIAKDNVVSSEFTGLAATKSDQYTRFEALELNTSLEELTLLFEHPNAVVRTYAFWALSKKSNVDIMPFLLKSINDSSEITTASGCIISRQSAGDFMFNLIDNNVDTLDAGKLSPAQYAELDLFLIETPNTLNATARALKRLPTLAKYHPVLKTLILRGGHPEALITLAKYKQQNDIPFLLSEFESTKYADDKSVVYQAIAEFSDPAFFGILKSELLIHLQNKKTFSNSLKGLYQAIARYKNIEAVDLLNMPFDKLVSTNIQKYHLQFVYNAIRDEQYALYNSMQMRLWKDYHYISSDVLAKQVEKEQSKVFAQIKVDLMNTELINYPSMGDKNSRNDSEEKVINTMLTLLAESNDPALTDILKHNVSVTDVSSFTVFSEFIEKARPPELVTVLLARLSSDTNPHVTISAVKALLAYNDTQIRNDAVKASLKNFSLTSSWGKEVVDKLFADSSL